MLLELTLDPDKREQMIHARYDSAFRHAAARDRLDIVNRLLELTPNPEERKQMIHAHDDYAFLKSV